MQFHVLLTRWIVQQVFVASSRNGCVLINFSLEKLRSLLVTETGRMKRMQSHKCVGDIICEVIFTNKVQNVLCHANFGTRLAMAGKSLILNELLYRTCRLPSSLSAKITPPFPYFYLAIVRPWFFPRLFEPVSRPQLLTVFRWCSWFLLQCTITGRTSGIP